jgi:bifunctional DNA-binding transcriptional regulator/antitoxin component of YhaV-PrlF toxin-antitoxin module
MQTMKMTSKRQVTLPVALCEELGITAGSRLMLDRRRVAGKSAWVLQPAEDGTRTWFGRLQGYAGGRSHDMAAVRASIARAKRGAS